MTVALSRSDSEIRDTILAACNEVYDPCSLGVGRPLGITDMGLVADVTWTRDEPAGAIRVRLDLITTAPFCLYTPYFEQSVAQKIKEQLPEATSVDVTWGDSTSWDESRMTVTGREVLRKGRERATPPSAPIME